MSSKVMEFISKKISTKYNAIARDDQEKYRDGSIEEGHESDSFISHPPIPIISKRSRFPPCLALLPWVTSSVLAIVILLLLTKVEQKSDLGSFESGFSTEFGPGKESIKVEQRRFTGSPYFDLNAEITVPNPTAIRYSGRPNPQMDAAWEELVQGRYIRITEEEGKDTWGDEYLDYLDTKDGGYVVSIDMFHTLHCLNQIRKLLYPEYYIDHQGPIHNGHCLDHIRQYVMCAGDLTPIPTRYTSAIGRNFAFSDAVHTCRNFQSARNWLTERTNGSTAVKAVKQNEEECEDDSH